MNVKMEENELRFKITEDELKALLSCKNVSVRTNVLETALVVTICPQNSGERMDADITILGQEIHINLFLPTKKIDDLSKMGRSREGLQEKIGTLLATVQVDIRQDSRRVGVR